MKKFLNTSTLLWLMGLIFVAFGVAICSKTNLGVSMIAAPTFVVSEALSRIWGGFDVGTIEYLLQGLIMIILSVSIGRFKPKFLLSFGTAIIYGYILNFFIWVLGTVAFDSVWLRFLMLIIGDILVGFGVACFFRTKMPMQVHELFVYELALRYKLNINKTKWIFDLCLLMISVVLAAAIFGDLLEFNWREILTTSYHNLGIGTIITTLINSPLIAVSGKIINKGLKTDKQ